MAPDICRGRVTRWPAVRMISPGTRTPRGQRCHFPDPCRPRRPKRVIRPPALSPPTWQTDPRLGVLAAHSPPRYTNPRCHPFGGCRNDARVHLYSRGSDLLVADLDSGTAPQKPRPKSLTGKVVAVNPMRLPVEACGLSRKWRLTLSQIRSSRWNDKMADKPKGDDNKRDAQEELREALEELSKLRPAVHFVMKAQRSGRLLPRFVVVSSFLAICVGTATQILILFLLIRACVVVARDSREGRESPKTDAPIAVPSNGDQLRARSSEDQHPQVEQAQTEGVPAPEERRNEPRCELRLRRDRTGGYTRAHPLEPIQWRT